MSLITVNNQGIKVLATNSFFYTYLDDNQYLICCGEYQNVQRCFAHNNKAGCAFCETDTNAPCECEE